MRPYRRFLKADSFQRELDPLDTSSENVKIEPENVWNLWRSRDAGRRFQTLESEPLG